MLRKIALLAIAGFGIKKLLDRTASHSTQDDVGWLGHVPDDLLGEGHPDGSRRADEHFRPDPTAPVSSEDRESLRPVTYPAPHDAPGL